MVAHTADIGAGWARQTRSHHAADRGTRTEVRRLVGQGLALLGQQVFKLCQGRARFDGDHQFGGLIADHAAPAPGVEHLGVCVGVAIKLLGVAALDAQLVPVGRRIQDAVFELRNHKNLYLAMTRTISKHLLE